MANNTLHIENSVNQLAKSDLRIPQCFQTFREMQTDEAIGAALNLIRALLAKADFKLVQHKDATRNEQFLTDALNASLSDMEGLTKQQFLLYILSQLEYGHSMFEMSFNRVKGKHVFNTFYPIHPISVNKYVYKQNVLQRLELAPIENDGVMVQEATQTNLKGDKVLMFKHQADLDHPLGRSLLHRIYTTWKTKQISSEYALIGLMKNLSGVLKLSIPSTYINDYYTDPTSANAVYTSQLMDTAARMHNGQESLIAIPSDVCGTGQRLFDAELLSGDSQKIDTNPIMQRLNNQILMSLYSDLLSLGQGSGGSLALADSKTNVLAMFLSSVHSSISDHFSKAIKSAWELNAISDRHYPTLTFDPIEQLDFDTFSKGWQRLIQSGGVIADDHLEAYLREQSNAPVIDQETKRIQLTVTEDNERDEKEK